MANRKPKRILYSLGPVDITHAYMNWATGHTDTSHFAITYIQQFYELCKELNAKGKVVSCRDKQGYIENEDFILEYRPLRYLSAHPLLYHLEQLWSGVGLLFSALSFKADLLIITQDRTHWFVLCLFPLFGIQVIPSLHCTLWPVHQERKKSQRILHALDRFFFQSFCLGICAVSDEIRQQIQIVTQGKNRPIRVFIPSYRKKIFEDMPAADIAQQPFNIVFVGRVEAAKGVYILLEVAKQLRAKGYEDFVFHICGTGSHLDSLSGAVEQLGLARNFVCHGYCNQETLKQIYAQSHVVIVPTTTEFVEGFNKVVLEGVLCGRPVVTSSACPSLSVVKEAAVEATPDSAEDYYRAVVQLMTDKELYEAKRAQALVLREKLLAHGASWKAKVRSLITERT